jgi:hypothetical protein
VESARTGGAYVLVVYLVSAVFKSSTGGLRLQPRIDNDQFARPNAHRRVENSIE